MEHEETLEYVAECIDCEGFDYCFINYSHFHEVKDVEFHRLREEYIAAHDALKAYMDEMVPQY